MLCSDLFSVSFRTTIIRCNFIVYSICSSNSKLASTIVKQTRTRILIKRIILSIREKITIRKIKNTMLRKTLQRSKTTTISKSFFFRSWNLAPEMQYTNNITRNSSPKISSINIYVITRLNWLRKQQLSTQIIVKLLSR